MALAFGSLTASKIYLGTTEVALAYLGTTQVYTVGEVSNYLRPDNLSLYRQPDAISLYKRPLGS